MNFEVVTANIAKQSDIEAVVNSANANLRFGSGVAGAIHSAAAPELEAYCAQYAPLAFGEALVTPAFKLPNKFVIHTRAAHYLHEVNAVAVLSTCMYSVIRAASVNNLTSIAVPAIGAGVFKFPRELAAEIMATALQSSLSSKSPLQRVRICVAEAETERVFKAAFGIK